MRDATSKPISGHPPAPAAAPSRWRTGFRVFLVVLFVAVAGAAGAGLALLHKFEGNTNWGTTLSDIPAAFRALGDPRSLFPGRDRITVLCLGLDRNILISRDPKKNGMPYTKGARSDVMMVASLDLASGRISLLSIPRDTKVTLPGRRSREEKINAAHSIGGIPYTRETVEHFLGVSVDYHVVIKQEAIQKVIDELGGLQLKVDKDMDYDDNWGQLHVHLREGEQRLNGEQVVGYMRFRHDPEGDFGRIRRQQQVVQALTGQMKRPDILGKAGGLIDAIREYIQTDLTPKQQLALAALFHKVQMTDVVTAQLPVDATATEAGTSYVIADVDKVPAAVDWIVNGNQESMHPLIQVQLKNASGDPELYQRTYRYLRHRGFQVWRAGRASGDPLEKTTAVQRTGLRGAARRVLEVLGLGGDVEKSDKPGATVTLYVGKDLSGASVLATADALDDLPDAYPWRAPRRRRTARRDSEPEVRVRILSEPDETGPPPTPPDGATTPPDPTVPPPTEGSTPPAGTGGGDPGKPDQPGRQ